MQAYSFFILVAAIVVPTGVIYSGYKQNLPLIKVCISMFMALMGAFVGARFLQLFTGQGMTLEKFIDTDFQNFALFGGLLGGGIAGFITIKITKLPIAMLSNLSFIWTGIGIGIIRIGCYQNGCCYGKETSLPWGIRPQLFSPAHWEQLNQGSTSILSSHPIHPTQIYELLAGLLASYLSYRQYKKHKKTFNPTIVWILTFTILRLIIYFFRAPSTTFSGPNWLYPLMYVLIILGAMIVKYLYWLSKEIITK